MDEFRTLLLEASDVMNSRPLIAVNSHSPDMVEPLTPGHFLHGTGPSSLPLQTDVPTTCTYGKRWRLNQYLANKLWSRWKQEYLTSLQQRNKWKTKERNMRKGDIILLKDDGFSRSWPMGRVCNTYPGKDGLVRAVDVLVGGKIYRRPVAKTVRLLGEDD